MPTLIYLKSIGFHYSSDDAEIKRIIDDGGKIITCRQDIDDIKRINHPELYKNEVTEIIKEEPKPQEVVKQRGRPKKWP